MSPTKNAGPQRFNNWPAIIPKAGEMVQIQIGDLTFESPIESRGTVDNETFFVAVTDPFGRRFVIDITPKAMGRGMDDRKPVWRTLKTAGLERQYVSLFLLN
jgi:hypothetical protein